MAKTLRAFSADGSISDYYPDFLVKLSEREIYIVETKGREDLDDLLKIERLKQWCADVNALQNKTIYKMLYVKQEDWDKLANRPHNFEDVARALGNL